MQSPHHTCPSALRLGRYHIAQSSASHTNTEHEALTAHIAHCTTCQQRLQELQDSAQSLSQQPDWPVRLAQHQRRLVKHHTKGTPKPKKTKEHSLFWHLYKRWWGQLSVLGATVLLAFVWLGQAPSIQKPQTNTHKQGNPKGQCGAIRMLHFRLGSRLSRWTTDREILHPNDLIQFSYNFQKPRHIMIASLNREGSFSVFVPLGGKQSLKVNKGKGTWPEKDSLELDDYMGDERIFMVIADHPFTQKALRRSIQQSFLAQRKQPTHLTAMQSQWRVCSLLIQKKPRSSRQQ